MDESPKPMEFTVKPVDKKPTRKYRKGSKYDAVIQGFIDANVPLAEVEIEGKTASYIATQVNKRLEDNTKWSNISISTANQKAYLENSKVTAPKKTPKEK